MFGLVPKLVPEKEAYMLTWDEFDEPCGAGFARYQVFRRNGAMVGFGPQQNRISAVAIPVLLRGVVQGQAFVRQLTFEFVRQRVKPPVVKLSGFFSATKANLRNAP